jgi:hypothetical protein
MPPLFTRCSSCALCTWIFAAHKADDVAECSVGVKDGEMNREEVYSLHERSCASWIHNEHRQTGIRLG